MFCAMQMCCKAVSYISMRDLGTPGNLIIQPNSPDILCGTMGSTAYHAAAHTQPAVTGY